MKDSLVIIGMLAGGLGLFLLSVGMITDGLKTAAGASLRNLLANWTRTPLHGIFAGIGITAVVQSSSAVTVATIGFVNAGIIEMRRALGIIFGSNIGTTMTGWLVAIIGFNIKVEAFALPLIGIGMILRLTGGDSRRASLGLALAGFGLFFIGIDVLKDAFEGLVQSIDLSRLTVDGVGGVVLYVGIGFLITVLTQSSSAAIAITLTAATGGVLSINAAAAMVIGANVGTTSTAALAVIGATANARRVATAHILFNAGTGAVALLILPILFWIVRVTGEVLGLEDIPAVSLALFHTVFNILGVVLIFPLTSRLASFLEGRFVTQDEIEGRPRYLDKTVASTPELALDALVLELLRVNDVVRRMGRAVLADSPVQPARLAADDEVVNKLTTAISEFITELEQSRLTPKVSNDLAKVLRTVQYLLTAAEEAMLLGRHQGALAALEAADLIAGLRRFYALIETLIERADTDADNFDLDAAESLLVQIENGYDEIKAVLLEAGVERRVPVAAIIDVIDQNSRARRYARELVKALRRLDSLRQLPGEDSGAPATGRTVEAADHEAA